LNRRGAEICFFFTYLCASASLRFNNRLDIPDAEHKEFGCYDPGH